MRDKTKTEGVEDVPIHCPICGRELEDAKRNEKGWVCKCGEFIPFGLIIDPFSGCCHGLGCNCGRERKT